MKANYKELKELLIRANEAYYILESPIMSDREFDEHMKELEKIEELQGWKDPDSPTIRVGSDINSDSKNMKLHRRPMLSLENTYSIEDVKDFINKVGKNLVLSIQPKYDGCSGSIFFSNGKVVKALTRGDGIKGEDITENIKLLDFSEIKESFTGEVRGELIMSKSGFNILNKDGKYQNARNLLAGSIKLLDHDEFKVRSPFIKFIAYFYEDSKSNNYIEDMIYLKAMGFDVKENLSIARNLEEAISSINDIESNAKDKKYDFDIDGAVIKIIDKQKWVELGSTAKSPRWAKAYKFEQEEAISKIESIRFQVGRTGKVTPVANITPVFLDGSTISSVTLNNEDYIKSKDIREGDYIVIHKAAAIIPEIVSVIKEKRTENSVPFSFIKNCPICGFELHKDLEEADWHCDNPNCSAKILNKLDYFAHVMEIKGLSYATLEKFYDYYKLDSIESVLTYILDSDKRKELYEIPGLGEKAIMNIYNNIMIAKDKDFYVLLASLGIPGIGKTNAKILCESYKSIDDLLNASIISISSKKGFGDILAKDIYTWLHNESNINLIRFLENLGFKTSSDKNESKKIIICVTGHLNKYESRNKLADRYKKYVSLKPTIDSSVEFLINNDSTSNSRKNLLAKKLNIRVITEEEFDEIMKNIESKN